MNDSKIKILIFDEMIRAGVLPWENNSHDMNKFMSEMSPEDQRKIKRKFRKLWRKQLKDATKKLKEEHMIKIRSESVGLGTTPNRLQRYRRRELLREKFYRAARARAEVLKSNGTDNTDKR